MFDDISGCYAPVWPVNVKREPRLRIAKFGDGYEQRILDGINWMQTSWTLKWPMRPADVLQAMDTFLTQQQGGAFPFYDPLSNGVVQVFCDSWEIDWSYRGRNNDYGDMSAEFRIAFGDAIVGALV